MDVLEGLFWSDRRGDGEALRLLAQVPPETLREDLEDCSPSSWLWRLNGNCALTFTIFLLERLQVWDVWNRRDAVLVTDPSLERTTVPSLSFNLC
jgi:hypothetical protein